ncbi:hypothetical protein [Schinkia azotoformans]|uniref:hypothetical protein n=1 Tax=Schinkia azotoformans TaxID=1454 RepID=UPI002DBD9D61|nr:hypothetical protein [Schinkia azotoformans]MEC1697748.1 hypothetical protein [Schinkia azotoformans]
MIRFFSQRNTYWSLVVVNLILLGLALYKHNTTPAINSLSSFFKLAQHDQFAPALLLGIFTLTTICMGFTAIVSLVRTYTAYCYDESLIEAIIALVLFSGFATGAILLPMEVFNKFGTLVLIGTVIMLAVADNTTTRRSHRY